ncbi:MAG: wax ester/triacylglycerol synthase family O-acyltransferase [Ahrensia sp.]|nr:wax ester/triacylglycerol synthase family O-acyltransferase [Ahrensia sp.]
MQQLSGIDATFLYFETPQTPMHVAGLTLYDLPDGFSGSFHEHFSTFFAGRLHLIPIFNKKLARTVLELDHPGWVDVDNVDLAYHIQPATLPKPGTQRQLEELVAELHAKPLDRKRPLWQFTVIEGLESGQVALYSKVHHAAIDGGAGMVITSALYDLTPEPRKVDIPEKKEASEDRVPTIAERAILGTYDVASNVVRQQMKAAEAVPQLLGQALDLVGQMAGASAGSGARVPQFLAPKTPFNTTVGRRRTYAARTVSLVEAKMLGKATGAKINDIVMAICAGALRKYLQETASVPDAPLVAFVPISLREAGNEDLNNQVFGMNCPLATQIEDPLARLKRIVEDSSDIKSTVSGFKDIAPTDFTLIGAPLLLPGLTRLYGTTGLADILPNAVNLCISNTAGPPFPLYCAGAKVTALYPVSIATHGVGLNITVQSYMDKLDFGVTAALRAVPQAERLGDLLVESFEELKAAAMGQAPSANSDAAAAKGASQSKAKSSGSSATKRPRKKTTAKKVAEKE